MSALLGSPISRLSVAGDEQNPLASPEASTALPIEAGKTPLTAEGAPKRVLLLEDDAAFREIMKVFFCEKGYIVHEAESGLDGIQEVMAADFSIILCDVQMPTLAGDLFYRSVERSRPEMCDRIVFMTGRRGHSEASDFVRSTRGRVLLKPFPLDELSAVMEVIEKQAASQESQANLARTPWAATAMEPPPAQEPAVAAKPDEKRVLLIEDDPAFREVMKEFLSEAGFTVREAQNGVQGIREVMGGEFAVILCDMMMPGLAGDHFYLGVERVRPHLNERFIFMTGHRGDARINAFIRKTTRRVLVKPFSLDQLLKTIEDTEKAISTPPNGACGPGKASPASPASSSTAGCKPCASSSSPVVAVQRPRRIFTSLLLPALFVLAGVGLIQWRFILQSRCAVLTADLVSTETKQIATSKELTGAELREPGLQEAVSAPARLRKERAAPKWTQALRGLAQAFGGDPEIQELHAGEKNDSAGACELHIDGLSFGPNRRNIADEFRGRIEQELQRDQHRVPVKTGFLRLDDFQAPPAAGADRPSLSFEIVATVQVEDARVFKYIVKE